MEDIAVSNAELAAELARKENGEPVVLLVSGHEYMEVISKTETTITGTFYNRYSETLLSDLEQRGFRPVRALRVIKANGNRAYLVQTPNGPDVYTGGKYHPAVRKKK
jgi:hypothetical protein